MFVNIHRNLKILIIFNVRYILQKKKNYENINVNFLNMPFMYYYLGSKKYILGIVVIFLICKILMHFEK